MITEDIFANRLVSFEKSKTITFNRLEEIYLSCYPLKIVFESGEFALIGIGSATALQHLTNIPTARRESDCILQIGRYCEFANCDIVLYGNHHNELPINITFGCVSVLRPVLQANSALAQFQPFMPQKTIIGHGVVVSRGCIVTPGSNIGDGVVLAAGAVASGSLPNFSIAGGVPAKVIKERFPSFVQQTIAAAPWWKLSPLSLARTASAYNHAVISREAKIQINATEDLPTLVLTKLSRKNTLLTFKGIEIGDRFVPFERLNEKIRRYFSQMFDRSEGEALWCGDIFSLVTAARENIYR